MRNFGLCLDTRHDTTHTSPMTTTQTRRPATPDDLTIGARCYKGKGVVEYVVTNRFERNGREWFTVAKTTSKAAAVAATGQPQWGGGMCLVHEFTVAD